MLENVEEGVAEISALLARFDEVSAALGDPDADFDAAARPRWASCRPSSTTASAWDIDVQLEQAMDALRCPPPDAMVDMLVRRRAPSGRALQAAAAAAGPAAARRADQPPRRRVGAVAGDATSRRTRAPSLAVTHDRYFLDNVAQWILELDRGRDPPVRGQLLDLPRHQEGPASDRRSDGTPSAPRSWSASWSGRGPIPKARQAEEPRRG